MAIHGAIEAMMSAPMQLEVYKRDFTSCGPVDRDATCQTEEVVAVGSKAPKFTLYSTPEQTISLRDFRGQPVILTFYPSDWSPVCSDQMALYNEMLSEFRRYDAQLLGISVDNVWSHTAFADDRNLQFPLLADFEPKGAVARSYGVYRSDDGTTERALFVIDSDGVVRWNHVSSVDVNPGANGILEALERLKTETDE